MKFFGADGISRPCDVIPLGERRAYVVKIESDLAPPHYFQWEAQGGITITAISEMPDRATVVVSGTDVSLHAGDARLAVTVDNEVAGFLNLTVIDVTLRAEIASTPPASEPARANRKLLGLPSPAATVLESTRRRQDRESDAFLFSPSGTLVLLQGDFQPVRLHAEVKPQNSVTWRSPRSRDDAPELGDNPAQLGVDGNSAFLFLEQTSAGSYLIEARVTCACGQGHSDLITVMPLVMVSATVASLEAKLAPKVENGAALAPTKDIGDIRRSSSRFVVPEQVAQISVWADNVDLEAVSCKASVDVISGGPQGRRLLEMIELGWFNTARGPEEESWKTETFAIYTDQTSVYSFYAVPEFAPHRAYYYDDPWPQASLDFPLNDDSADCNYELLGHARGRAIKDPLGAKLTVEWNDLPNNPLPMVSPLTGMGAAKLALDMRFSTYLSLVSKAAPNVVGVLSRSDWRLSGAWEVDVEVDAEDPMFSTIASYEVLQDPGGTIATQPFSLREADKAGAEVLGPGTLTHLANLFVAPSDNLKERFGTLAPASASKSVEVRHSGRWRR
ncbi:MAG TPA: hypothetical protein VM869_17525 [Enhygromyxa sp.]|nr:hypothetical protein [Enhygromyxa sp.]